MADDNEFEYIVGNLQRMFKLNSQYEYHSYVDSFKKEGSVVVIYGTYVLEGEADTKFLEIFFFVWKFLQSPENASKFCKQMINCMGTKKYIDQIFPWVSIPLRKHTR